MKQNDVILAGGELNRSAHLRREANQLRAGDDLRILPLWRGNIALDMAGNFALLGQADLPKTTGEEIFLGVLSGGEALFAADLSGLEPVAGRDPEAKAPNPWSDDGAQIAGLEHLRFFDLRAIMTRLFPLEAELAGTARGVFEWHHRHGFCAACGARTEIADAGWRRDCPACEAAHFPRTDPVVIMLVTHGNSVLLGRNANWPDRMYSLLAGFVEPGEPIEAAVRREVFEEAGVRVGEVSYVASQPWPFPASLMFGCQAKALSTEITIDPEEISDARWVSREEVALAMAGQHPEIAPPRKGAIAQYLLTKWLADC